MCDLLAIEGVIRMWGGGWGDLLATGYLLEGVIRVRGVTRWLQATFQRVRGVTHWPQATFQRGS